MLIPVIIAGGSGTRLWPLSRQLYPKQFCALVGETTMFQQTILRLRGFGSAPPLVVCNEEHRFLAAEQLRLIGHEDARILLEPFGRNTAPAIALAALQAAKEDENATLLVLPADHLVEDVHAFQKSVGTAVALAKAGRLVTFGIVPDRAETGYGYIRRGKALDDGGFSVSKFEEKPDAATAEEYLGSGDYLWNSGMFVFSAAAYLDELGRHAPAILDACRRAVADVKPDLHFLRIDRAAFEACPSDSVDYSVMEKTEKAAVVPLDAGWNDIGSWSALWSVQDKDEDGNALKGDVLSVASSNTLVDGGRRLVAVLGVEDLIIVDTDDALLVAHKTHVQDVKQIVEALKGSGRSEHVNHRKVYRPWGHYDSIDIGQRDQVKRITVNPGAKLSVQMHHHRAEHWVVVRGAARVQKGDQFVTLSEDQSTYIPVGEIHSLENPGKIPLELIEVQSGSYLGEDDIVRFEDKYGRS